MSPLAPLVLVLALASGAAPPPAPSVAFAPAAARPGDAVLVTVSAGEAPRGTLAGRALTFWRAPDGWRALAALPMETPPGPTPAVVEQGGARAEATLEVVPPGFASATLTVAPGFVEPPPEVARRIAADRAAFAKVWASQGFEPPLFDGPFTLPRETLGGGRFGDQRVFNGKQASVHYGLDLRGRIGDPVRAPQAGRVVLVRDAYMSGKTVVLWHGAGVFTLYFHLSRIDVRPGARVKAGQRLGAVGNTGRSTGPHLHWGVKVDGLYVDPESLVAIDPVSGTAPPRAPGRGAVAPPTAPEPPPAEAPVGVAPEAAPDSSAPRAPPPAAPAGEAGASR